MEEKLKPCPFCGGECQLDSREMGAAREVWHFVWCPTCKITGGLRKSREEALLMWNTRAPQEPQWQQMTPDTKFEDGESLFVEDWHSKVKLIVVAVAGFLIKDNGRFVDKDQISRFFRIPK